MIPALCVLSAEVILKGLTTLKFVYVCFVLYVCVVIGFVNWRQIWEEFWNVDLLMTWIWLSWGDLLQLTGHWNPITNFLKTFFYSSSFMFIVCRFFQNYLLFSIFLSFFLFLFVCFCALTVHLTFRFSSFWLCIYIHGCFFSSSSSSFGLGGGWLSFVFWVFLFNISCYYLLHFEWG